MILVGLWPAADTALTDERTRKLIGADYYAARGGLGLSKGVHRNERCRPGPPLAGPDVKKWCARKTLASPRLAEVSRGRNQPFCIAELTGTQTKCGRFASATRARDPRVRQRELRTPKRVTAVGSGGMPRRRADGWLLRKGTD